MDVVKTFIEAVAWSAWWCYFPAGLAGDDPAHDRRPVSIIGTFAVMKLLGFSLNNVSLFAWYWRSHRGG